MRPFLLDTNALSDLVRDPVGPVRRHVDDVGAHRICTSIVVACEMRFGALRKGSMRLSAKIDDLLHEVHVHPLESPVEQAYARLRLDLERAGRPIGGNDLLIAAHALCLECILVTANTREFERVPGLDVENWSR